MKRPVIDAEFEIVSGIRERKPSFWARAGRYLLWLALNTAIATAFAGIVAWLGLFVLNLKESDLNWLSIVILVTVSAGAGLLRKSPRR